MNNFTIIPADDFIWNRDDLLRFLVRNQGKSIIIDTRYEGCCSAAVGLYKLLDLFDFKSVVIKTTNILETHQKYIIRNDKLFKFFDLAELNYNKYQDWNGKNIFGAFYNRAIWHRIGLAAELYDYNTLLNFRADPGTEDNRQLFELQKLFEIHPESAKKFLNLLDRFPKQLEQTDGFTTGATTQQHTDQLCQFYSNILIDIVSETFVTGRTFFATEKTIRPMLLKKPFIIMGPKNFMIYLRQMGFRTFYEYWDEDYDGFENKERYLRILKLIDSIATKSLKELTDMYNSMQDILDHNYNLLSNRTFNKDIRYVE